MTAEQRFEGPVVVVRADTDPGDVGDPRVVSEDGTTFVFVPPDAAWGTGPVLTDVAAERRCQDVLWGSQRQHSDLLWNTILGEEVGEVAEATLHAFEHIPGITAKPYREQLAELRAELVQVAAVCVAWAEAIDARGRS